VRQCQICAYLFGGSTGFVGFGLTLLAPLSAVVFHSKFPKIFICFLSDYILLQFNFQKIACFCFEGGNAP